MLKWRTAVGGQTSPKGPPTDARPPPFRSNPFPIGPAVTIAVSKIPVMVCACGKRLRAPGAVPGRVGRCPACGGELRVPEAEPEPEPTPAGPSAYGVDPIDAEPGNAAWPPAVVEAARRKRKANAKPGHETAIWDGFVKAPDRLENRLGQSLLYPLWGANGIASLVVFPPLFWFSTMPIITAVHTLTLGGASTFGIGSLFLGVPMLMGFAVVAAYALMFLGRVLASSALGERHHPRWPDWDLGALAASTGRWAWAGFIGAVVGGVPAVAYWVYCGDVDLFDYMILSELAAVGMVYALMALVASILHEDLLAANPFTVVGAIVRVGWGYAQPCLLAGFAGVVAATVLGAVFRVENPAASAFLYWVFWVVVLYEAMVVLRVLGVFYQRNARTLGWFRGRTGWGV